MCYHWHGLVVEVRTDNVTSRNNHIMLLTRRLYHQYRYRREILCDVIFGRCIVFLNLNQKEKFPWNLIIVSQREHFMHRAYLEGLYSHCLPWKALKRCRWQTKGDDHPKSPKGRKAIQVDSVGIVRCHSTYRYWFKYRDDTDIKHGFSNNCPSDVLLGVLWRCFSQQF